MKSVFNVQIRSSSISHGDSILTASRQSARGYTHCVIARIEKEEMLRVISREEKAIQEVQDFGIKGYWSQQMVDRRVNEARASIFDMKAKIADGASWEIAVSWHQGIANAQKGLTQAGRYHRHLEIRECQKIA